MLKRKIQYYLPKVNYCKRYSYDLDLCHQLGYAFQAGAWE